MFKAIGLALCFGLLVGIAVPALAQTDASCADVQTGSFADSAAVRLTGVIVTAVLSSGASGGFWVQDPPSGGPGAQGDPFSGIFCFIGQNPTVSLGDSVNVTGAYAEYFTQSELNMRDSQAMSGVDSLTQVISTGALVPAPKELTVCDLAAVASNTPGPEQWEGVLVEVDSVEVRSDLFNGEWSVEEVDGDASCVGLADSMLVDDKFSPTQPPVGTTLATLRGVFDDTFNFLKLQPRGDFDIVFAGLLPAPTPQFAYPTCDGGEVVVKWDFPLDQTSAEDEFNYSFSTLGIPGSATLLDSVTVLLTTGAQTGNIVTPEILDIAGVFNRDLVLMSPATETFIAGESDINFAQTETAGGDTSQISGQNACIAGIVTAGTDDEYYDDGFRFFIETTGGGPYSGIEIRNTLNVDVSRGDSVCVCGLITENFGNTVMLFLNEFQLRGAKPVPGPDVLDLATAITEPYEGVLVEIAGSGGPEPGPTPDLVALSEYPCPEATCFFEITVVDSSVSPTDTVLINDSDRDGYAGVDTIAIGDRFCHLRGPMHWDFGARRVLVRDILDICLPALVAVDQGNTVLPIKGRLDRNVPNPFNPSTMIRFAVPKASKTSLVIYDISGRSVRTLVNERLTPGEYSRRWDGLDEEGRSVASGIYFYSLKSGTFQQTRKMVMLK